jgi:hypothetical protein
MKSQLLLAILQCLQIILIPSALFFLFKTIRNYNGLNEGQNSDRSRAKLKILNGGFDFKVTVVTIVIAIIANLLERVIKNWPLF